MLKRGTDHSRCKGPSCSANPTNGLARADSYGASTRHPSELINSWPKACLAASFFLIANYVLLEDVLRHGAPITTDHLLSEGALVAAVASGHFAWPALRAWKIFEALVLTLVFVGGTGYCLVTAAGRNAAALADKAAAVSQTNGAYAELEGKAKGAADDLAEAQRKLEAAEAEAKAATDKADDVCAKSGAESWRCERERSKSDTAEGRKAKAEKTRDDKRGASIMADARLSVATKRDGNADLAYAAKLLAYFGVNASAAALADLLPFLKAILCELATLGFSAGAFGHRSRADRTVPAPAATVPRPTIAGRSRPVLVVDRDATVPHGREAALALLRSQLAVRGAVPQDELKELFGVRSRSTISRWCDAWEASGEIVRTSRGRTKTVSLNRARWWRSPRALFG